MGTRYNKGDIVIFEPTGETYEVTHVASPDSDSPDYHLQHKETEATRIEKASDLTIVGESADWRNRQTEPTGEDPDGTVDTGKPERLELKKNLESIGIEVYETKQYEDGSFKVSLSSDQRVDEEEIRSIGYEVVKIEDRSRFGRKRLRIEKAEHDPEWYGNTEMVKCQKCGEKWNPRFKDQKPEVCSRLEK